MRNQLGTGPNSLLIMADGRRLLSTAIVAGGVALLGFVVGLTDPTYYQPETLVDYSAALLTTGSAIATAVSLWVWGSAQDRRVSTLLLRVAALAYSSWGLGNLIEDVIGWSWGDLLFVFGGMASVLVLAAAGIVIVITSRRWRWFGFVPVGLAAALALDEMLIAAITWFGFVLSLAAPSVLQKGRARTETPWISERR